MKKREIYAAGLSCRFPESDSPFEFFQNLLSKRDLVTSDDRRWKEKVKDLPLRFGKLKQNLNVFDNQFFSVHGKQAEKMDPQLRLLLEISYEALVDAGISLNELKGSKTGVYIGACSSDAHKGWLQNRELISGYEHTGCATSMLANRLSFFYDLHGPSETIDTACSSSLVAFHRAVSDLESGVCDYAIVGGASIILWSHASYAFHKLKMLSPDGACKSFDQSANGFARAEGVAVIVLTLNKNCKNLPYAKILASGVNNGGWNSSGITFPSGKMQKDLYRMVCEKAGIHPKEIDYLEAHGTGTVAGDGEELDAIYEIYGKENPELIIGSVKSNMGHCEGASGLAGLIKVLLCFDQETLAPNIHLHNPNEKLKDMRVATQPILEWKGSKAAVSSFGFGGTNAHLIIEKNQNVQNEQEQQPFHLGLLAHRTKEGLYNLKNSLQDAISIPNSENKQKLSYREVWGLPDDPDVENISDSDGKIYLACSGNGSQWKGMGVQLCAEFPVFRTTIESCAKAVGYDLVSLLKKGCSDALENTLGLVSIQIGLIELLKTFGINETNIGGYFGHSAGEIVCSYLDNLTTLEETMKIALARGSNANQTDSIGLMASIGLSQEEMQQFIEENRCTDRVCIACLNSPRNVTISGYKENVLALVEKATERNLFARTLDTFGKAYHSFLFAERRNDLKKMLQESLGEKKGKRSEKWTTSIWNHPSDIFDLNYHVNAVIHPVDFINTLHKVPKNGTVLEIGPHSVLKNLIKDNRPDLRYCCLMKKENEELLSLKEGLGKLWKYGVDLDLKPQQTKKASLDVRSNLVSWNHNEEFPIPNERDFGGGMNNAHKIVYNLAEEKDKFLNGHVIDGKILLPATSYLCSLWDAFCKIHHFQLSDSINYCFTDFEILQAIQVEKDSKVELSVEHLGENFELKFKDEVIAKAKITTIQNKTWNEPPSVKDVFIDSKHFYRIVASAGYEYQDAFRVIEKIQSDFSNNSNYAEIRWNGNWIAFLDGVLQCMMLEPKKHLEELRVPVKIRSIVINPSFFNQQTTIASVADFDTATVTLSGIEMADMETKVLSRKHQNNPNKLEIKEAAGFLYYGKNVYEDPLYRDYGRFITNYAIQLCSRLIEKENLNHTGHYKKILDAFNKWGLYTPVEEKEISFYRQLPACITVRILENNFKGDGREFLEKPLHITTQHPEYGRFYFEDPTAALHDKSALPKFLSVVRDNNRNSDLNILEIGSGTGGFTRLIAPYLINDRYIATDITESSQTAPIDHVDFTYEKFNLNEYDTYGLLQKHSVDLLIASNALHTGNHICKTLKLIYDSLKEGAFLLIFEVTSPAGLALFGMDGRLWSFEEDRDYGLWLSLDSWIDQLKKAGLELICYSTDKDQVSTLFLVRKPLKLKLELMEAPSIDGFEEWYPKIKDLKEPTLLVSRGIAQSGVEGFTRTLNKESDTNQFYCLSSDQEITKEIIQQIEKYGLKINRLQNGRLGTACHFDVHVDPTDPETGYAIKFPNVGDFSTYEWHANPPPSRDVVCTPKYVALNFKDVMLLTGKVSKDAFTGYSSKGFIGVEFSGHDVKGNRYMGMMTGLSTQIDAFYDWIIPIPSHISYEEAATIPVVYGTVYYALFHRAHIKSGQTILIHAAAGGVGQAATQICLQMGCQVFVTCHHSKKAALKELFPELKDSVIFDSRSIEFERQVLKQTQGKGVDFVLNSLADDKLQASLRCVAREGHFLEIGKYDIMKHTPLDMHMLIKNTTIHGVDLDQLLMKGDAKKIFSDVEQGLLKGIVKPLPRHIFHHTQLDEAFRFMASGKHIGKVLIDMENINPKTSKTKCKFPFYQNQKEVGYCLVTGGLGGFGLALLQWLFNRGVKRFLVTSRKGITTGEQQRTIEILRSQGADIRISTHNVSKWEEVQQLIDSVKGNICSVFHLAMSLEDGLFQNMTPEKWNRTVQIKAMGAINLDKLTRSANCKHFVVFSSFTSRYGNIGQSNYTFGNSVMEEICKKRLEDGFHAIAIQWGAIDNVGFVANHIDVLNRFKASHGTIKIEEALDFIDSILGGKVNSHCVQYSTCFLNRTQEKISKLTSEDILVQIENVIKMDLMKCNASQTLEFLGIDSLQVVEIQTILIKWLQEVLPLKKISSMKIGELIELIHTGSIDVKENRSKPSKADLPSAHSLLNTIHKAKSDESVYLFLGLGVDPKYIEFPKTDRFHLHIVNWHQTATIESIIEAIQNDVKKNNHKKVTFLSHSAGYQMAKAVIKQGSVKIDRLAAISLVSEKVIQNTLDVKNLENVSNSLFEASYQNAAFFVENHLPIEQIKQQSILLSKLLGVPYLPPHLILNPREDPICDRSNGGTEISGNHKVSSFDLQEIYEHL